MRVIPNMAEEFEEICAEYNAHSPSGRDIVTLTKMFMDKHDYFEKGVQNSEYSHAWDILLKEHMNQASIQMVGMVLYLLVTYWQYGQRLYENLPALEKMLLRDTVQEISEEIQLRSAANGDAVIPG